MESVASAAGITKASLYRRYANKAALLEAVAGLVASDFDVTDAFDPAASTLEQIRQLMWTYRQRAVADERLALQQLVIANLPFHASLRETVTRLRELSVAPVNRLVAAARDEGALPTLPVGRVREYLFDLLVNGAPSLALMGLPQDDDEVTTFAWRWALFRRSLPSEGAARMEGQR